MKFLFAGAIHPVLQRSIINEGHESFYGPETDWYRYFSSNRSPEEWAHATAKAVIREKPDVFVLCKGLLLKDGKAWCVPIKFLWWVKKRVKTMVFVSYDCPASTPLYIEHGLLAPFDLFGTTCVGISTLFAQKLPKRLKIFEFWLGFNQNLSKNIPKIALYECDLALTGTPYYKPFEPPHYRRGFGFPRRDLILKIRRENPGIKIHLYGPKSWLNKDLGGHPSFKPLYKGWIPPDSVHLVHRAAKVCLGTQLVQGYRYESGRCIWTGGAGGFILHEDRPGLRDAFGRNVMWFNAGDVKHCHKQLIIALKSPEMRASMTKGLHKLVWEKHTWQHRAQTLIETINKHG